LRARHRIGLFGRRRQGKLRVHGRVCARVKPSGTGSLGLPRGRTEALLATCAGILLISRLGSLLSILSGPGEDVCCGPQSISQDFTVSLGCRRSIGIWLPAEIGLKRVAIWSLRGIWLLLSAGRAL
jgi:hypothetical protein